jgi:hypothetical protein
MGLLETIATVASLAIIITVALLIRRGRLLEKYALLWLAASLVLLVFSLFRGLIEVIAGFLGIYYGPSFLFLAGFVFLMLLLLHFSIVISGLSASRGALVREVALLRLEVERLRRGGDTPR